MATYIYVAAGNTATALTAPINGQAVPASTTSLNVAASSVANATSYRLYTSSTQNGTYTPIGGTLSTPNYTHTGLTAGQAQWYQWQAVGNGTTYTDSPLGAKFSGTPATVTNPTAPIGTMFSRTNFTDLSGLTLSSGVSVDGNGAVKFAAGQSGTLVRDMPTGLNEFTVEWTQTIDQNDANNYGFGLTMQSIAGSPVDNSLKFFAVQLPGSADFGKLAIYDTNAAANGYSTANRLGPVIPGFAIGAAVHFLMRKTATEYSITGNVVGSSPVTLTVPIIYYTSQSAISTNTTRIQLGGNSALCAATLTQLVFASTQLKNARWAVGDSITWGFNAGASSGNTPSGDTNPSLSRWATTANMQIQAGPGDRVQEVIARLDELITYCTPSRVFPMIGTNNSLDQAYMDGLATIKSRLDAAGIPFAFVTPPANRTRDMSTYRDYLVATYPNNVIDVYATTKATNSVFLRADYDGDGTHPTKPGHVTGIAGTITASPLY